MARFVLVSMIALAGLTTTGCCGGYGAANLVAAMPADYAAMEEPAGPVAATSPLATPQKLTKRATPKR